MFLLTNYPVNTPKSNKVTKNSTKNNCWVFFTHIVCQVIFLSLCLLLNSMSQWSNKKWNIHLHVYNPNCLWTTLPCCFIWEKKKTHNLWYFYTHHSTTLFQNTGGFSWLSRYRVNNNVRISWGLWRLWMRKQVTKHVHAFPVCLCMHANFILILPVL